MAKKRIFACLIFVITFIFNLLAQTPDPKLSESLVRRAEIIKQQASASPAERTAAALGDEASISETCLSPILTQAKQSWLKLTPTAQQYFQDLSERPKLPSEENFDTQHFRLHFTKTGANAVPPSDANQNQTPDYIEKLSEILEHVYTQYENKGYTMPPEDSTDGGNGNYDVYILDIGEGLYGFVSPEYEIGDNLNSPETKETEAHTSWMAMNNNYKWAGNVGLIGAIKVTAAHEFFHAVQMATTISPTEFLSEASATWAEDEIYPNIDDNVQYLHSVFSSPDISLDWCSEDGNTFDGRWYGSWLFFKYLTEQKGSEIVRRIIERCINESEMEAIENELSKQKSSLYEIFKGYCVANSLLSANRAYKPYTYARANVYAGVSLMRVEKNLAFYGNEVSHSSYYGNRRLMRLGADQLRVTAKTPFFVSLSPQNKNAELHLVVVKRNTSSNKLMVLESKHRRGGAAQRVLVSDPTDYDQLKVLVIRQDADIADTLSEQYTVRLSSADEQQFTSTFSAQNIIFSLPTVKDNAFRFRPPAHLALQQLGLYDSKNKLILSNPRGNNLVLSKFLTKGTYLLKALSSDGLMLEEKISIGK
jgi:hypothetical protein